MAQKVFLHVGAPLTPTTVLRDALARHRRRLARVGVLCPPSHLGDDGGHRDAVLDALSLTSSDHAPPPGAWDRLAETVRDWRRGTAVISHELLAEATESQVDRIVTSLGSAEVHVVLVAQDLGRQVPRAWQQWVYAGGTAPFASYAAHVVRRESHRASRVFWRSHDLGEVLSRWSTRIPAERVHVVSAARGEDADETTWARFAEVIGIDPLRFRLGVAPAEPLASLAGTEVVRLLNTQEGALDPRRAEVVRRHSASVAGAVPLLPEDLREAATAEAELAAKTLRANGWELVGRLADLCPQEDAFASTPDAMTPAADEVLRAQSQVLHALCAKDRGRQGPAGVRRRALRVLRDRVRP